jgi:aspartyl-tRNA synthetase
MIAGLDRYYQVARCYRDESTRVDRQPEFTQIDIEMSFITDQDLMRLVEDLLDKCWPPELASTRPSLPINRMKYKDAMDQYGVDKPDVRFDMRMNDVTELFAADAGGAKSTGVNRIDASLKASGSFFATAIRIPKSYNTSSVTLNEIEKTYIQIFEVTHFSEAQVESKKGFTFLAFKNKSGTGVAKHLNSELRDQLIQRVGAEADDIVLVLVSNNKAKSQEIFGKVRLAVADLIDEKSIKKAAVVADAKKITPTAVKLIRDPKDFKFLWVVEFPLFNRNEDTNEFESCHHPFTAPIDAHLDLVREKRDLDSVIGLHYDLVLNGCEIAGGSIRVHSAALQRHILEGILGESVEQLAHLIEALEYGAPPHGGIAFGLDRLVAMMCNTSNIRNVIAFPKSHSGRDLMSSAPSAVAQEELDYYKIRCVKE